jgi:hypothetical protein
MEIYLVRGHWDYDESSRAWPVMAFRTEEAAMAKADELQKRIDEIGPAYNEAFDLGRRNRTLDWFGPEWCDLLAEYREKLGDPNVNESHARETYYDVEPIILED